MSSFDKLLQDAVVDSDIEADRHQRLCFAWKKGGGVWYPDGNIQLHH